jgi:uncharacterized OB-fold protein
MTTATTIQPESRERLIEEGLFRLDDTGTPRLRGSKCSACGTVFLGRRFVCLACFDLKLEETDLSAEGEVYSFTTVRQQSPDSLIAPPYTVVQVKLPERIIVTAPLLEIAPGDVAVGLPVRTKAFRFTEPSGQVVVSYAFVAARAQSEGGKP